MTEKIIAVAARHKKKGVIIAGGSYKHTDLASKILICLILLALPSCSSQLHCPYDRQWKSWCTYNHNGYKESWPCCKMAIPCKNRNESGDRNG